ncbi:glycoside hydrolase family 3 N-terminal domain-containing protein [Herbaspirillum sp. VT-16-41]|uniref:glycoside hydrolase family 3 N-terminal domain-containing protein n=1 Tax=Herbaspirillum sp. VT-16-41 TaxID=1953765 RepID=UPI001C2BCB64|nr:glycoside hydrolase family 3 N-terminal domain-containing protein [Herbaspirillum sp. VT-16-41]
MRVSERALREIYLRGFQLMVRESSPWAIMTSYNKINGVWGHYHYDLITSILRGEWGFTGLVMTDWWMRMAQDPDFPALHDSGYRVRAGVDVLMPGSIHSQQPVRDEGVLESHRAQDGLTPNPTGCIFFSGITAILLLHGLRNNRQYQGR